MMRRADGPVLLTGATGFIGMELLARYLERTERPVLTIVRAGSDEAARERIDAVLENLFGYSAGRYARPRHRDSRRPDGAASRPGPPRWDWLAAASTMIVHCAASVSFGLSLEEARAINVEGTRRMLELAEPGAGARRARPLRPGFHRVCRRQPRRPVLRVRPRRRPELQQLLRAVEVRGRAARALATRACRSRSCARASSSATATAAGPRHSTSSTGRCGRSRAGCSRRCRRSASAPVDVVSIDYVADGIYELCEAPAGSGRPTTSPPAQRRARSPRSPSSQAAISSSRRPGCCRRLSSCRPITESLARCSRKGPCTSRTSRS